MAKKEPEKKIIDFGQKYTPSEKQALAHSDPARYVLYGGSLGGGKSVWLCAEAIQLSLDYEGNRGYLCRHESITFKKTTLLTLQQFLPMDAVSNHNKADQFYEFINGSRIYYGGLKPSQSQKMVDRIKSMDLGWFGIDEASETQEDFFLMLCSRLRIRAGSRIRYRGCLTSNPEDGWVKRRFIDSPTADCSFIPSLAVDNPFLPKDYVERLEEMYGSRPDWIARYLEGSWDVPSGMGGIYELINYQWIKAAAERSFELDGTVALDTVDTKEWEKEDDGVVSDEEIVSFGVDVAAGGLDKSVIVLRVGKTAKVIWETAGSDTMQLVGIVSSMMQKYNPSTVKIDYIGVGTGVVDRLLEFEDNEEKIIPFVGGASAVEDDKYYNCRAEAYWQLRQRFEEGRIAINKDDELMGQLTSLRYEPRSDRRIIIESKKAMKKRGVRSPDKADALAMAFYEPYVSDLDITIF